jgi:hypothetical protein
MFPQAGFVLTDWLTLPVILTPPYMSASVNNWKNGEQYIRSRKKIRVNLSVDESPSKDTNTDLQTRDNVSLIWSRTH